MWHALAACKPAAQETITEHSLTALALPPWGIGTGSPSCVGQYADVRCGFSFLSAAPRYAGVLFTACKDFRGGDRITHQRHSLFRPGCTVRHVAPLGLRLPALAFLGRLLVKFRAFSHRLVLLAFVTALQLFLYAPHRGGVSVSFHDTPPYKRMPCPSGLTVVTISQPCGLSPLPCPFALVGEWGYTRRVFPGPAAPAFVFAPWPWGGPLLSHG